MSKAKTIINKMYENDAFSQWLGIERLDDGEGFSHVRMIVREEMTNGFGVTHGGITYSLADSALAFACNSHGMHAMSVETSISHVKRVIPGDVLTAKALEKSKTKRLAVYDIEVTNQEDTVVALFKGMVYRSDKKWDV